MPSNNNDASIKGGRAVYINAVHRGGGRGGGSYISGRSRGKKKGRKFTAKLSNSAFFFLLSWNPSADVSESFAAR